MTKEKLLRLTPDNFENYRKSVREDMISWANAHSHNIRRLDVMLVLVSSAIFYDTTNIVESSSLKLITQIAALGTIALSIIDHGYARFKVPNILKKSEALWIHTMNTDPKHMNDDTWKGITDARKELFNSQRTYSIWIQVFLILEIFLAFLAIAGEFLLRM